MDEKLDDALEREARRTRRSKSAVIRDLVRERIKPFPPIEEDPLWEMVGADSYEPVKDIDEFLYGPYTAEAQAADRAARRRRRRAR
jgi:hypothetical protein